MNVEQAATAAGMLGRWYADPVPAARARALLHEAGDRERRRARRGLACTTCRLQRMAAGFWLGEDITDDYEMLVAKLPDRGRRRALTELVYGQLLMSRRLRGAAAHLRTGFELGTDLFVPADYFRVLERHRLLLRLPLSAKPHPPATLPELLMAAGVAERIVARPQRPETRDETDLHG